MFKLANSLYLFIIGGCDKYNSSWNPKNAMSQNQNCRHKYFTIRGYSQNS